MNVNMCICDHANMSHTLAAPHVCQVCSCDGFLATSEPEPMRTIPSITDVYGYIRSEILYCQRRHRAAVQEYKRNHWYERWATLHDAGTAFGMVNLPAPGTHGIVGK